MRYFGKGVKRKRAGVMNGLETKYAQKLEAMKFAGEIVWFSYEPIKLVLADRTTYTPDFLVMLANGDIEAHEVKGFWLDAASIKIKVAAEKFPFRFKAITYERREWVYEEF
jgi:hypothetical protein